MAIELKNLIDEACRRFERNFSACATHRYRCADLYREGCSRNFRARLFPTNCAVREAYPLLDRREWLHPGALYKQVFLIALCHIF
jgi:hypothetical protein